MRPSARPKVVGTGLIALDFVLGPEKDEPIRYWAGGTCGNVLAIMAYLGWDSFPVARMNGDAAARAGSGRLRPMGCTPQLDQLCTNDGYTDCGSTDFGEPLMVR